MQQSKAYVIKAATRNLKATIASRRCAAARKAEYVAYRYGTGMPYARKVTLANVGGRHNGN